MMADGKLKKNNFTPGPIQFENTCVCVLLLSSVPTQFSLDPWHLKIQKENYISFFLHISDQIILVTEKSVWNPTGSYDQKD